MSKAEEKTEEGKAPWKTLSVVGIALFFGFVAGAILTYLNFKRMGLPGNAKLALFLIPGYILLVVTFTLAPLGLTEVQAIEFFGFVHFGSLALFYTLLKRDFLRWKEYNPETKPSRLWSALPWGLVGILITGAVGFAPLAFSYSENTISGEVVEFEEFGFSFAYPMEMNFSIRESRIGEGNPSDKTGVILLVLGQGDPLGIGRTPRVNVFLIIWESVSDMSSTGQINNLLSRSDQEFLDIHEEEKQFLQLEPGNRRFFDFQGRPAIMRENISWVQEDTNFEGIVIQMYDLSSERLFIIFSLYTESGKPISQEIISSFEISNSSETTSRVDQFSGSLDISSETTSYVDSLSGQKIFFSDYGFTLAYPKEMEFGIFNLPGDERNRGRAGTILLVLEDEIAGSRSLRIVWRPAIGVDENQVMEFLKNADKSRLDALGNNPAISFIDTGSIRTFDYQGRPALMRDGMSAIVGTVKIQLSELFWYDSESERIFTIRFESPTKGDPLLKEIFDSFKMST